VIEKKEIDEFGEPRRQTFVLIKNAALQDTRVSTYLCIVMYSYGFICVYIIRFEVITFTIIIIFLVYFLKCVRVYNIIVLGTRQVHIVSFEDTRNFQTGRRRAWCT